MTGGHRGRNRYGRTVRERVLSRLIIDPETGCLLWTGTVNGNGYGQAYDGARTVLVHRLMHEWFIGPIPDGYQVDHLCRVRHCASPAHLEAVTPAENKRRSVAAQPIRTKCRHGHPYNAANTYWPPPRPGNRRGCRACRLNAMRAFYARKKKVPA